MAVEWDGRDWVLAADTVDATGVGPAHKCAGGGSAVEITLTAPGSAPAVPLDPAKDELGFFEADREGDFAREVLERPSLREAARHGIEAFKATATAPPGAVVVPPQVERTPANVSATGAPGTAWRSPEHPGDRATVVVRGRPDGYADARPSISAVRRHEDRGPLGGLSAHPERIAAWAVGLGFVLILTAVSTADAAVRLVGG